MTVKESSKISEKLGRKSSYETSWVFHSPLPLACANKEPVVLGVDEAGRGPVLGPMVYALAFAPIAQKDRLKDLGFADSKTLKEEDRDRLFLDIEKEQDWMGFAVYASLPNEISGCMLRRSKYSLNALAHDITIQLLRETLERGVNVQEVYIDTVGPPATYQAMLEKLFPRIKITVAKKADSLYPIVSAASICAKVTRDSLLKDWQFMEQGFEEARDFGCGYPSDPKTVAWLKTNMDPIFGFPSLIRFSWSTTERILDDKCVKVIWPALEGDQSDETQTSIKSWFKKEDPALALNGKKRKARDAFYVDLGHEHVTEW